MGQVVTVPTIDTVLSTFTFYMRDFYGGPGTLTFRGEVYAWDGVKATGPNLWESTPRTLTLASSNYQAVDFSTAGVPLVAGKKYVLFVSISKDYEKNDSGTEFSNIGCVGYLDKDTYDGGGFVFLNDLGEESKWTSTPWETFIGDGVNDLAFAAQFSSLPATNRQCRNGGWSTYGVFENQSDCISAVRNLALRKCIFERAAHGIVAFRAKYGFPPNHDYAMRHCVRLYTGF